MTDEQRFYWDFLKHELNTFNNRGNLFLVGESMLLIAFSTLSFVPPPKCYLPLYFLCLVGIFVSIIWLYIAERHRRRVLGRLREKLKAYEPFQEIIEPDHWWPYPANKLLAFWLPLIMGLLWVALLIISLFP